ncbi:hypothetical protein [Nitrosomonas communis]|uniref:Uncharacterized protein n=1 Tax=Nitrosomonas communis TaxID=44574 RepID=A0A1H2YMM1_9PROT|nr:hypothetical protein [Nitrosomonas communis]SDX06058.1 hypothetical protein SAMN05421882_10544 [Nitrosomonas communis]
MLAAEPISERFGYRPPSFGTVSRGLPVAREKFSLVLRDLFAISDMFRPPRGKPASWLRIVGKIHGSEWRQDISRRCCLSSCV